MIYGSNSNLSMTFDKIWELEQGESFDCENSTVVLNRLVLRYSSFTITTKTEEGEEKKVTYSKVKYGDSNYDDAVAALNDLTFAEKAELRDNFLKNLYLGRYALIKISTGSYNEDGEFEAIKTVHYIYKKIATKSNGEIHSKLQKIGSMGIDTTWTVKELSYNEEGFKTDKRNILNDKSEVTTDGSNNTITVNIPEIGNAIAALWDIVYPLKEENRRYTNLSFNNEIFEGKNSYNVYGRRPKDLIIDENYNETLGHDLNSLGGVLTYIQNMIGRRMYYTSDDQFIITEKTGTDGKVISYTFHNAETDKDAAGKTLIRDLRANHIRKIKDIDNFENNLLHGYPFIIYKSTWGTEKTNESYGNYYKFYISEYTDENENPVKKIVEEKINSPFTFNENKITFIGLIEELKDSFKSVMYPQKNLALTGGKKDYYENLSFNNKVSTTKNSDDNITKYENYGRRPADLNEMTEEYLNTFGGALTYIQNMIGRRMYYTSDDQFIIKAEDDGKYTFYSEYNFSKEEYGNTEPKIRRLQLKYITGITSVKNFEEKLLHGYPFIIYKSTYDKTSSYYGNYYKISVINGETVKAELIDEPFSFDGTKTTFIGLIQQLKEFFKEQQELFEEQQDRFEEQLDEFTNCYKATEQDIKTAYTTAEENRDKAYTAAEENRDKDFAKALGKETTIDDSTKSWETRFTDYLASCKKQLETLENAYKEFDKAKGRGVLIGKSTTGLSSNVDVEKFGNTGAEIFNDYREQIANDINQVLRGNFATGLYSTASGSRTRADGNYSWAENRSTWAEGNSSHAEGVGTYAKGNYSHAEGFSLIEEYEIKITLSFLEWYKTHEKASDLTENEFYLAILTPSGGSLGAFLPVIEEEDGTEEFQEKIEQNYEKYKNSYNTVNIMSSAELINCIKNTYNDGDTVKTVKKTYKNVPAYLTDQVLGSLGNYSHTEGYLTTAQGKGAHAEGQGGQILVRHFLDKNAYSFVNYIRDTHEIIVNNEASSSDILKAFKEKYGDIPGQLFWIEALVLYSGTTYESKGVTGAVGDYSHSEGMFCQALGSSAHSEGRYTRAFGTYSHSGGSYSSAFGIYSFVHGRSHDTIPNYYIAFPEDEDLTFYNLNELPPERFYTTATSGILTNVVKSSYLKLFLNNTSFTEDIYSDEQRDITQTFNLGLGRSATILGMDNLVMGINASAIGTNNVNYHNNTNTIGRYLFTNGNNQTVVGEFNFTYLNSIGSIYSKHFLQQSSFVTTSVNAPQYHENGNPPVFIVGCGYSTGTETNDGITKIKSAVRCNGFQVKYQHSNNTALWGTTNSDGQEFYIGVQINGTDDTVKDTNGKPRPIACVYPVSKETSVVTKYVGSYAILGNKDRRWYQLYVDTIGDSSRKVDKIHCSATYSAGNGLTSDKRLKEEQNSSILQTQLNFYNKLNPIAYKYKNETEQDDYSRTHVGFFAQEVEQLIADSGLTSEDCALVQILDLDEPTELCPDGKRYYLNYNELHALHVAKNQEQDKRIEGLENKITELEKLIKELTER